MPTPKHLIASLEQQTQAQLKDTVGSLRLTVYEDRIHQIKGMIEVLGYVPGGEPYIKALERYEKRLSQRAKRILWQLLIEELESGIDAE